MSKSSEYIERAGVELSKKGRKEFKRGVKSMGRTAIDADACLDEFETDLDPDSDNIHELPGGATKSGRLEVFWLPEKSLISIK